MTTPYGAWPSPLSAADVAATSVSFGDVRADAGRLYWVEHRPAERGRSVLVRRDTDGRVNDTTPPEFSVRTRVHEYGGLAFAVRNGNVVFCNLADQRLYVHPAAGREPPRARTPDAFRYADLEIGSDASVVAVREDHSRPGEPVNAIVVLSAGPGPADAGRALFDTADFVAYPRRSPSGAALAFIRWNHPNMPWDGTELVVGTMVPEALTALRVVAGGRDESVLEPQWDADGTLYFLSDRTGWWNLYRWRDGQTRAVTALEADLGGPLWGLGSSTYALTGDGRALVRLCRQARDELAVVNLASGHVSTLPLPFVAFASVGLLDTDTGFAVASSEDTPPALVSFKLVGRPGAASFEILRQPTIAPVEPAFISRAEAIEYPTTPGADGTARTAHAFFYPPRHPHHTGRKGERPPLIVLAHGGPTSHSQPSLKLSTQFWTSRGFAVVDVNYGGSTGFGRAYRERLGGQWGVVDLQDVVGAVDTLGAAGRIDGARVVIRGGSAGGFTVLCALAFTRRFTAGVNYFGVADLESLAADTHKFESRYLDKLIAPLPEGQAVYQARSPIHHLERLDAALLTLQGARDRAVPPEQSRAIVAAVREKGRPVAYLEFPNEEHGFRDAANIARGLEAELYFLGRILGFSPADRVEPVRIDNLD